MPQTHCVVLCITCWLAPRCNGSHTLTLAPLYALQVPNTSPSAASASSDLYCSAVMEACTQLQQRLQPFRTKGRSFQEAIKVCSQSFTSDCTALVLALFWMHVIQVASSASERTECVNCIYHYVKQT